VARSGEFPFELAGDVVTQDLGRILASVSGGDVSGMIALMENERGNEWVRSVAMAYFLQLFHKLERKPGAQWDGLAHVCADRGPQEAIEELGRACADGLVDTGSIDWQDIEHALALGQQGAMQRARYRDPLISDLAKNMGWMQCFHDEAREYEGERDAEENLRELRSSEYTTAPVGRTAPKVGRNEPCPCGSGQKFRKYCALR
jgi:hypothetical protein